MSRATLHPPSAGAHFPTIHQSQSRLRLGICIVIVIIIVVGVVILAAIKAFLACLMFILQFKFAFIWSFSFYTTKAMCAYKETKLKILQINVQIAQIRNVSKYVQEITKVKEFEIADHFTSSDKKCMGNYSSIAFLTANTLVALPHRLSYFFD